MQATPPEPPARRARVAALAVLLAAAPLVFASAGGGAPRADAGTRRVGREARGPESYDAPREAWREGPVRYLLTKDEDDAFRTLRSDPDRAAFIQRFWTRRDPRTATPENEFRARFYRRVEEANRLFRDSPRLGWMTDRGKIYILLGPPDEQEQLPPSRGDRETILWTYRDPPSGMGLEARSAIRFVRDASGEFHLSSDVFLSERETTLGLGLQVQAMQMASLPEPRQVLDTIVTGHALLDATPFRTHQDFLRSAGGNTYLVLTVGVKRALITTRGAAAVGGAAAVRPDLEVIARLVGDDPGLPTSDLAGSGGLKSVDEPETAPGGYSLYQGATALPAGRYTAFFGIVDPATKKVYSFKEPLVVPALDGDALSLSGVTLARRLAWTPEAAPAPAPPPYPIGGLLALPRLDDTFRSGETLVFYYQIGGAATDPIVGRPDLDVEYQFAVARGTGSEPQFEPLGEPIRLTRLQNPVQGYAYALKDWPPATYRLRVLVKDNLSDRQASRDVTFRVL
jgi:GWxTD domain-containing protein